MCGVWPCLAGFCGGFGVFDDWGDGHAGGEWGALEVPVGGLLVGVGEGEDFAFGEVGAGDHEADGHAGGGEAAGDGDGGDAVAVEG